MKEKFVCPKDTEYIQKENISKNYTKGNLEHGEYQNHKPICFQRMLHQVRITGEGISSQRFLRRDLKNMR